MSMPIVQEPITPTAEAVERARESFRALAALLEEIPQGDTVWLKVSTEGSGEKAVGVPRAAARLLLRALREMAQGHEVAVLPLSAELTTQQAADLLGASRPHVVKLLEQGRIPFHRVGSHRRIVLQDLLRYQAEKRARREEVMRELVAETERLDLYR